MDAVKFSLGDTVYHKMEPEEPGLVTGILFRETGHLYFITWSNHLEVVHYEMELTREKGFISTEAPK